MGTVFKYGENVDTDVIIPARHWNTSDPKELAKHCMEDIDADFAGMNSVWDQWLPKGVAPARATVEAKLCEPEILVELSVVAALP